MQEKIMKHCCKNKVDNKKGQPEEMDNNFTSI